MYLSHPVPGYNTCLCKLISMLNIIFINIDVIKIWGFPGGSVVKNLPANAEDKGFDLWVRKILWRKKWQPSPIFLPRKSHG